MKKQTQKNNKKRNILLATLIPTGVVALAACITLSIVLTKPQGYEQTEEGFLARYGEIYTTKTTSGKKYGDEDIGNGVSGTLQQEDEETGEVTTFQLTSISYGTESEEGDCYGTFVEEGTGSECIEDISIVKELDVERMKTIFKDHREQGNTIVFSVSDDAIGYKITNANGQTVKDETINNNGYFTYLYASGTKNTIKMTYTKDPH